MGRSLFRLAFISFETPGLSSKKYRACTRAVNLYVTISATGVLRILVVRWTTRLVCADAMVHAVTRQAEVIHRTELQHSRIG
jgi:hypothetical protein